MTDNTPTQFAVSAGPAGPTSAYLTARQAAEYLGIPYSTFRKKATGIPQCRRTKRYHKAALDRWAQHR